MDLAALVREVVAPLRAGRRRGRAARWTVDAPDARAGRWDRLRLEQVVTNLLTNALKYGAGKPVRGAACGEEAHGRGCGCATEGIGIAPEDQPRIFERFERAVATAHYGGLGLGLYITRQIVEALGGTIRVESRPARAPRSRWSCRMPGYAFRFLSQMAKDDDEGDEPDEVDVVARLVVARSSVRTTQLVASAMKASAKKAKSRSRDCRQKRRKKRAHARLPITVAPCRKT